MCKKAVLSGACDLLFDLFKTRTEKQINCQNSDGRSLFTFVDFLTSLHIEEAYWSCTKNNVQCLRWLKVFTCTVRNRISICRLRQAFFCHCFEEALGLPPFYALLWGPWPSKIGSATDQIQILKNRLSLFLCRFFFAEVLWFVQLTLYSVSLFFVLTGCVWSLWQHRSLWLTLSMTPCSTTGWGARVKALENHKRWIIALFLFGLELVVGWRLSCHLFHFFLSHCNDKGRYGRKIVSGHRVHVPVAWLDLIFSVTFSRTILFESNNCLQHS